jgi:CRISPR-associated protein Csx17
VTGFGLRPLRHVLADVLAWRSRTAAADAGQEKFRGVPTFRYGIQVPAADLHAFATGLLDEAALDLLLRACLALDWWNVRPLWSSSEPVTPLPALGLLHPLAQGLVPRQRGAGSEDRQPSGDAPMLALSPDWANRLIAGQVRGVHEEAAARLRQAGWLAVPALPRPADDGISIAAALVPRCRRADALMERHFAVHIPQLAQEMS